MNNKIDLNNLEETKLLTKEELEKVVEDSIKDETIDTYVDRVVNDILAIIEGRS